MKELFNNLVTKKLWFWVTAIVALVLDLWSKSWAQERLTVAYEKAHPEITYYLQKPSVPPEGEPLIQGFLHLRWAENTGAAFSIGSGQTALLLGLGLGVLGIMLIYVYRMPKRRWVTLWCLGLIAGGAIGNIYDRTTHSAPNPADHREFIDGKTDIVKPLPAVRDFLYWPFDIPVWSTWNVSEDRIARGDTDKWPIFNVADCTIVGGVIILVVILLFEKKEEEDAPTPEEGEDDKEKAEV